MDDLSFSLSCSFSSDVDENAVEELLSQFLDEEVLKITRNPVGSCGPLDPELEARYEKLKASSASKPRPRTSNVERESKDSCFGEVQKREYKWSPPSETSPSVQGDSNSNWSPGERRTLDYSHSSTTFMASPSHRSRSISPPPPRSCFCGSPKKLLRSISSKKLQGSRKTNKTARSEDGSDISRLSRQKPHSKSTVIVGDGEAITKSTVIVDDGEAITKSTVIVGDGEVIVAHKSKMKDKFQDELDSLSDEELLTDLSTFSLKRQEKQLKKAAKEEYRINRDAEELVKWVKQASARMDVSVIDDLLSDEEELK